MHLQQTYSDGQGSWGLVLMEKSGMLCGRWGAKYQNCVPAIPHFLGTAFPMAGVCFSKSKAHVLLDKPLLNTQAHPARFELLTDPRSLE